MTAFDVEQLGFEPDAVKAWDGSHNRTDNWPVVYALDGRKHVYVGETGGAATRMRQHLKSTDKTEHLRKVRVIFGERFNKSACLDLESFLIQMFSGDGKYEVLNRNDGIRDRDYFDRGSYQATFREIFERLRSEGLFTHTLTGIVNSDLYKLSPYKALNDEQAVAVRSIIHGLFDDLASGEPSTAVVQGEPGTGKTVVAIFLMKLIEDVKAADSPDDIDIAIREDALFADYFHRGDASKIPENFRVGLVVPQVSLRSTIEKVFKKTRRLDASMVVTPFDVGKDDEPYDLLIVDEAHRLNQYAAQSSGVLTKEFREISARLFSETDDVEEKTQIDWIRARSRHQIFLVDEKQAVRPADVRTSDLTALQDWADHKYTLRSQMRIRAGEDYLEYVRDLLSDAGPDKYRTFDNYEFRMYDDIREMRQHIRDLDGRYGLSRLVAGYAWKWTKKDPDALDVEIDGLRLPWNRKAEDWINSATALDEVGCIHTVQGYDLNYAGVIIGQDLRYDPDQRKLFVDRDSYHDARGKANNKMRNIPTTDEDLLRYIRNIYSVLLTRGMSGTFVYVCDPELREHLRPYIQPSR